MEYEPVIGLEVHLQLSTRTKVFCGCSTLFGQSANSQTCPVCLGLPGSLPKLNAEAFRYAIKVALALGCEVQRFVKFDRKNYYYPDLPKNFQITQFDKPVAFNGEVILAYKDAPKMIRIKRVHLEEDAGKLIHEAAGAFSLVDYNRTGMPLLEIVTEPDIASPGEAYDYLVSLKAMISYLGVSDCDMEKGSLRCDANISMRPRGTSGLGVKVELKNMNSFKNVRAALEYEAARQAKALISGEKISQETRLWDVDKESTASMRSKEEAHDYRYFPEPDLVPLVIEKDTIEDIRREIPELPAAKAARFAADLKLSEYDAGVLVSDSRTAGFFEETIKLCGKPKAAANWITGGMMAEANERGVGIGGLGVTPQGLAGLIDMIEKGAISGKMAKDVLTEAIKTKKDPAAIVGSKGLSQISDASALEPIIKSVVEKNAKSVGDYRNGKLNALGYLVGQVMKETGGKANPALVNELLKKIIERV